MSAWAMRCVLGLVLLAACGGAGTPSSPIVRSPLAVEAPPPSEPLQPPPALAGPLPVLQRYEGFVLVERVTALSGVDEPRLLAQAFDAQHALRECYEADMTTAGMYATKLAFRLVFQWDGALLSAERDPTSPIGPGPMVDCMTKALNQLIVPPHGELGRAILVLALQPR